MQKSVEEDRWILRIIPWEVRYSFRGESVRKSGWRMQRRQGTGTSGKWA